MPKIQIYPEIHFFNIDAGGHLSNIAYIQWMEIARVRLLEAADLPPQDLIKRGIAPVLTRTEIQYKKMLLLGDRARVDLHIAQLKGFSAKLDFSFWRLEDNELVAQGRQEAIFISLETQKPHKLTPEERQAFEQFM